jgi:hypothetical protein
MSYTIYGFRKRGDSEVRYVGMTSCTPESRLYRLTLDAQLYGRRATTGLGGWLLDNESRVDVFEIVSVATRADARIAERAAVRACLACGHNLFNHKLVPAEVLKARQVELAA